MKKLLVFTDLDGSLLSHADYSWEKASTALQCLEDEGCPVIFTSSKTASEILDLKQDIGNPHPFISENGAAVSIPDCYFDNEVCDDEPVYRQHLFSRSYEEIITILNELRDRYQYNFRGFNDMDSDELSKIAGLTHEQAFKARQRQASEPLLWRDTGIAFEKFKQQLEKLELITTAGGRFIHVMSDVNKGRTIEWLLKKYQQAEPQTQWVTVGIGDSFNDIEMLEVVDYPVLISNARTRQPNLSHVNNLQCPQLPGPAGWNKAMLGLLKKIG